MNDAYIYTESPTSVQPDLDSSSNVSSSETDLTARQNQTLHIQHLQKELAVSRQLEVQSMEPQKELEQQHLVANEQLQQTNEEQMKRLQRANEELTIKQTQHDMEKKNLRDECETLKLTVNDTRKKVLDTKRDEQMIRTHFELNIASSLRETKSIMEEANRKDRHIGRLEDTVVSLKERCKRSGVVLPLEMWWACELIALARVQGEIARLQSVTDTFDFNSFTLY